ncbi:hypothetical protein [Actinomadura yumaensis]|uniref:Uncharacterized protein n=1 Tax=Actinomadura yumaensis TaxID=111807 RepID=A0ABW2CRM3_9ACTN
MEYSLTREGTNGNPVKVEITELSSRQTIGVPHAMRGSEPVEVHFERYSYIPALQESVDELYRTAEGDSNDDEIQAGHDLRETVESLIADEDLAEFL